MAQLIHTQSENGATRAGCQFQLLGLKQSAIYRRGRVYKVYRPADQWHLLVPTALAQALGPAPWQGHLLAVRMLSKVCLLARGSRLLQVEL